MMITPITEMIIFMAINFTDWVFLKLCNFGSAIAHLPECFCTRTIFFQNMGFNMDSVVLLNAKFVFLTREHFMTWLSDLIDRRPFN